MSEQSKIPAGHIVCPRSWENQPGAICDAYKLHYAAPAELKAHGGVCAGCAEHIRKFNGAALSGRTQDHHERPRNVEVGFSAAWTDDGPHEHDLVPSVDFDFDHIDEALGVIHAAPVETRAQAAELFRRISQWCFTSNSLRASLVKLIAVFAGINPELMSNRTMKDLGTELGVTRALVSKQSLHFQDAWGVKFTRSRSASARRNMAESQIGHAPRSTRKRSPPRHKESFETESP